MNSRIALFVIGWLAILIGVQVQQPEHGQTLPCQVTRIIDGDTLEIEFEPRTARIRLLDCWCKEAHRVNFDAAGKRRKEADIIDDLEAGQAAKAYLASLAEGRAATIWIPYHQNVGDETTLGRVLGRVYVGGCDLSVEMVESGHAKKAKP